MKKISLRKRASSETAGPQDRSAQSQSSQGENEFVRQLKLRSKTYEENYHPITITGIQKNGRIQMLYGTTVIGVIPFGKDPKTLMPRLYEFTNRDCIPIEGNEPRICPHATPAVRKSWLPVMEAKYRELGLVSKKQTVLYVGREATPSEVCEFHAGCDCFGEMKETQGNGPPESVLAELSRDQARLLRFLWGKTPCTATIKELRNRLWRRKPVQLGSVTQAVIRLSTRLMELGSDIDVRQKNGRVTLTKT